MLTDRLPCRRKVDFILKMGFIFSGIHLMENLGSGEPEALRDGKL